MKVIFKSDSMNIKIFITSTKTVHEWELITIKKNEEQNEDRNY